MAEETGILATWKVISIVIVCFLVLYFFVQGNAKQLKESPEEVKDENLSIESYGIDPNSHHLVFKYMMKNIDGQENDPIFEKKSLNNDLKFNSVSFAYLLFLISKEKNIPLETMAYWLSVGNGEADSGIAILLQQIEILSKKFNENEIFILLLSGAVGDKENIKPIAPEFDSVDAIIKYSKALIELSSK